MTMSPPTFKPPLARSALVALRRAIDADFQAHQVDAAVYLGLKYRNSWDTSRVVLIDGEFSGEGAPRALNAGQLRAPGQKASFNPRELAAWPRPLTISIRGVDKSALDDEDAQLEAQEALVEATLQAVWNAVDPQSGKAVGQANIEDWGPMLWVQPPIQQSFGKELLVGLVLRCVFYDRAQMTVVPTAAPPSRTMLNTAVSGNGAAILSSSAGVAVVGGLGYASADWVGLGLELSGAASPGNNGTFPIVGLPALRQVTVQNAGAVPGDANNGKILWRVVAAP